MNFMLTQIMQFFHTYSKVGFQKINTKKIKEKKTTKKFTITNMSSQLSCSSPAPMTLVWGTPLPLPVVNKLLLGRRTSIYDKYFWFNYEGWLTGRRSTFSSKVENWNEVPYRTSHPFFHRAGKLILLPAFKCNLVIWKFSHLFSSRILL